MVRANVLHQRWAIHKKEEEMKKISISRQDGLVTQFRRCGRGLCSLLLVATLLYAPCFGQGRKIGRYSNAVDWGKFGKSFTTVIIIAAGVVATIFLIGGLSSSHSKSKVISVDPLHLDFGKLSVGNATTHEIKLVNRGVSSLYVDPPSISGNCFSLAKPWVGPLVLEPGINTFSVVFTPGLSEKCSGILKLTVMDTAKKGIKMFTIRLAGKTNAVR